MIFQGKIVLRGTKSYTTCSSVIQYFYNITSLHYENITDPSPDVFLYIFFLFSFPDQGGTSYDRKQDHLGCCWFVKLSHF